MEMWLSIENMKVILGQREIVKALNFSLQEGEIACLLGPSGCGKTTALRTIAGFESVKDGKIILNGQVLSTATNHIAPHVRQIGMVFQDYALFPHLTVSKNIAFGLRGMNQQDKQKRVTELLDLINLSQYGDYYPHQLSGGQQQRIAIARALAPKPQLLLLDEPFSNLDADLRTTLAQEVRQLLKKEKITAILVTHDQEEAFVFSDKIGLLSEGVLQQWDEPENLFNRPCNPMVAEFFGKGQWLKATVVDDVTLSSILGDHPYQEPHGFEAGNNVCLLVRTQNVICSEQDSCNATVAKTEFRGEYIRHYLILENGEQLIADWPSLKEDRVSVSLDTNASISFAI